MNIAIIGSGIAGLTVAHHLHPEHEITVYEKEDHIGGHVHTLLVFGHQPGILILVFQGLRATAICDLPMHRSAS